MEKLELGKIYQIGKYDNVEIMTQYDNKYFMCHNNNVYKDIFTQFNIEEKEIYDLLGYKHSGIFPPCNSLEDLQKVYEYIMSKDPNNKKTINVEDLKYPHVIHITNKRQWDCISKSKSLSPYSSSNTYYLIGGGLSSTSYIGNSIGRGPYINYEFEDIIFPEEKQEDKFIVGKWYTYLNNYIKFTHRKEHQIWGEKVKDGKYYPLDYWSNSDYVKNCILVTDLSKIQHYLPEGHIDKEIIKKEKYYIGQSISELNIPNKYFKVYNEANKPLDTAEYNLYIDYNDSKITELREGYFAIGDWYYKWFEISEIENVQPTTGKESSSIEQNELTSLPEKWCISRDLTSEQNLIVTKWINTKFSYAYSSHLTDDYYYYNGSHGSKSDYLFLNLTEITYEQFKKWVIKEETDSVEEEWKPVKGEWCYYEGATAGGINTGSGFWEKGVIAKFDEEDRNIWRFTENSGKFMNASCSNRSCAFRKATPEEVENYLKTIKTPIIETKEHYNETINSNTTVEHSTKGTLPLYNVKKRLVLN